MCMPLWCYQDLLKKWWRIETTRTWRDKVACQAGSNHSFMTDQLTSRSRILAFSTWGPADLLGATTGISQTSEHRVPGTTRSVEYKKDALRNQLSVKLQLIARKSSASSIREMRFNTHPKECGSGCSLLQSSGQCQFTFKSYRSHENRRRISLRIRSFDSFVPLSNTVLVGWFSQGCVWERRLRFCKTRWLLLFNEIFWIQRRTRLVLHLIRLFLGMGVRSYD